MIETQSAAVDPHAVNTESEPSLGHHFDDLAQQEEANTLGMWIFLATEILFFGALFLAYLVYRSMYPEAFAIGSQHLNVVAGSINTVVLLTSSLFMAIAVYFSLQDNRRAVTLFLLLTAALGAVFLGIKAYEWITDWNEGLVPGLRWTQLGKHAPQEQLFFVLYFVMTGLHAVHLTIGIVVVGLTAVIAWWRRHPGHYSTNIEMIGLYWHFVDIVWVFLFPLLYLINLHR